jgi:hypothetical protein
LVNYSSGISEGATSYEWWLPYPFETVDQFDYFGQNWQKLASSIDSSIQVFTGYAQNSGYIQVMGKNECGFGGANMLQVSHGGGGGGAIASITDIFKIFPNPSNNIVNIELNDKKNHPPKGAAIYGELFDFMGQSKSIIQITKNKTTFSVAGLNQGIYVLKIYINNQIESHQIVVE